MLAAVVALSVLAPPATLPARPGWHLGSARVGAGCARCVQTESWAATVAYQDGPNEFPHRTMAILPRDGIIVHVSRSWQPSPPAWMLERHPLRIRRSAIHADFEGNTTRGRVSLWLGSTWRAGSYVSVYVYFGSPRPAPAVVARAQAELDGARFRAWRVGR